MVDELREYCRKTLEGGPEAERTDWAFGAVDFALTAGIISSNDFRRLIDEFELLG